jgi:hypothetical protein
MIIHANYLETESTEYSSQIPSSDEASKMPMDEDNPTTEISFWKHRGSSHRPPKTATQLKRPNSPHLHSILNWCSGVFALDKHVEDHTLG